VDGGEKLGFLASKLNPFGEFGFLTDDESQAINVVFSVFPDGSPFNLMTSNSPILSLPYIGAVEGWASTSADLIEGSFNYVYLTPLIQSESVSPIFMNNDA
jgi:hypothetical protein